jgi:hypothetical protein
VASNDAQRALAKIHAGAVDGLKDAVNHLLDASQEIVPIEPDEALKRSGRASIDETKLRAAVAYGGQGVGAGTGNSEVRAYAVRQHEDLDYQHDPGRAAKYLETPFVGERDVLLSLVAEGLRKALR